MFRRLLLSFAVAVLLTVVAQVGQAEAQQRGFGQSWGGHSSKQNLDRFYHYPYVTYPHNYWGSEYYRSSESMYYRYPAEMRIPVYNRSWQNYYPSNRRYHSGHQFVLDVF